MTERCGVRVVITDKVFDGNALFGRRAIYHIYCPDCNRTVVERAETSTTSDPEFAARVEGANKFFAAEETPCERHCGEDKCEVVIREGTECRGGRVVSTDLLQRWNIKIEDKSAQK